MPVQLDKALVKTCIQWIEKTLQLGSRGALPTEVGNLATSVMQDQI